MVNPSTVAEFVDLLRRCRLLGPAQFDEVAGALGNRFTEPVALARDLIARGWLTPYQVNQLFLGRGSELLMGSFVLLERLGEGGMGQVFKARNWKTDRIVALKLIHKDRLKNSPSAVKRFEREIRAAAQLDHPHIVRAVDADQIEGVYLFAMELVPGVDLAHHVKACGPLPVARACTYIRQAALGLQHAFEKELVHRDIKPSNLLLATPGDVIKVLDLGLARSSGADADSEASSTLTQEGLVMGTPDYLAPEQALDAHAADIRADLYSLGCTFYFLLTAKPPFPGGSTLDKLIRHREQEAPPIERLRPDVPPAVAAVIRRLMAKRPGDRYQTPAELADALAHAAVGATAAEPATGIAAGRPPGEVAWSAIVNTPTSDSREGSSWVQRLALQPRGRGAWLAAALAALAFAVMLAASGGWWYLGRGTPEPDEPPITVPPRNDAVTRPVAAVAPRLATQVVSLQLRAALPAHAGGITSLAYASTGKILVTAGHDPEVRLKLWDATGDKLGQALPQPKDVPLALALAHDGGVLAASGRGGSIELCEPATGKLRERVAVTAAEVRGVVLAPDGSQLYWVDRAADGRSVLRMRDVVNRREPAPTEADTAPLLALAATGSGRYLAAAGQSGKLRLFEAALRQQLWSVDFDGPCPCLAMTADSTALAAAGSLTTAGAGPVVRLWSVPKGEPRGTLGVHTAVTSLAFTPDSSVLAIACTDGTVRLWDWDRQRLLAVRPAHPGPVRAVAFSADGKTLATGGDDGILKLWDIRTAPPSEDALAATRLVNTLGMALQLIAAGEFTMGQDALAPQGPQHKVRIIRPYYLGAQEVTVGQFRAFVRATGRQVEPMPDGPSWQAPGWELSDDHPVVAVSHDDAVAFCRWLSKKEGRTYRLPTEAEWERAAQANRAESGPTPGTAANHREAGLGKPVPIGCYSAGALGLCNLAGNVAEWCADWYEPAYYKDSPPEDPSGPSEPPADARHATRGGTFDQEPAACTATHRQGRAGRHLSVGFRVLMEPSAEDLVPWQSLWAGKDLDGWAVKQGRAKDWVLEDGRLICKGGTRGWLGTKQRYADFLLRLDWRIPAKGDSGVYLRVPTDTGNPTRTGIQVQIADNKGMPNPASFCGGLQGIAAPSRPMWRGPGEWNTYQIACRGQQFTVTINGEVVADIDGVKRWEASSRANAGLIGLENWGTRVEFQNAQIKVLKEAPPLPAVPRVKPLATFTAHTKPAWRIGLSADAAIIGSASDDKQAILWDRATGTPRLTLPHDRPVTAIAVSADGSLVVTGGKDMLLLWDGAKGTKLQPLIGHKGSLAALAILPDGKTLASGGGEPASGPGGEPCVRLWELPSGKLLKRLAEKNLGHVDSIAVSRDGRYLAAAGWSLPVFVWDLQDEGPAHMYVGHRASARTVALAPDGNRLASASRDGTVRVWDRATRKALGNYRLESGELSAVQFSPDGKTLAVGDEAGQIHLVDAAAGTVRALLLGHDGVIGGLAFSRDGTQLVSCSDDATVRTWDVSPYCRMGEGD